MPAKKTAYRRCGRWIRRCEGFAIGIANTLDALGSFHTKVCKDMVFGNRRRKLQPENILILFLSTYLKVCTLRPSQGQDIPECHMDNLCLFQFHCCTCLQSQDTISLLFQTYSRSTQSFSAYLLPWFPWILGRYLAFVWYN